MRALLICRRQTTYDMSRGIRLKIPVRSGVDRRSSARLQKGTHFSLDSFFRGMKFTKIPANQVNFFKKEECTISGENRRQSILLFLVLFLVKHFI